MDFNLSFSWALDVKGRWRTCIFVSDPGRSTSKVGGELNIFLLLLVAQCQTDSKVGGGLVPFCLNSWAVYVKGRWRTCIFVSDPGRSTSKVGGGLVSFCFSWAVDAKGPWWTLKPFVGAGSQRSVKDF